MTPKLGSDEGLYRADALFLLLLTSLPDRKDDEYIRNFILFVSVTHKHNIAGYVTVISVSRLYSTIDRMINRCEAVAGM
jgi:hypothetical protein